MTVAQDPRHAGVVIAGDAGVGKTRLAEELLTRLETAGRTIVRIRAARASSLIPYGALAPLVPDDLPSDAKPLDMARALERSVSGKAGGSGRVVMLVDDVHHLDDLSAALIAHLATGACFLIVTMTSASPTPEAIVGLWKDGIVERIDLEPMSRQDSAHLLQTLVDGPLEEATVQRLWQWTGGNPLFLREIALAGREAGSFSPIAGVWVWRGPMSVNGRLCDLISSRLSACPPAIAGLLELLALGEPLEPALLGPDRAALHLATTTGLVAVEDDGTRRRVRFTHPLYGEVLRARLDATRSAELHLTLARRLEASDLKRRSDVLRLSTWYLGAGLTPGDPAVLLEASRQALASGDHGLALQLASYAFDEGGGASALVARAEASYWSGHHDDVQVALRDLDSTVADDEVRARAAIVLASSHFWGQGDAEGAHRVLATAEEQVATDRLRQELYAHQASLAFFTGRLDEAVRIGHTPMGGSAHVRALPALLASLAVRGDLAAVRAGFEHGILAARDREDAAEVTVELMLARCLGAALVGELGEAEQLAATTYAAAVHEFPEYVPTWALLRGRIAMAQGALDTAGRWLRDAVAGLHVRDPAALLYWGQVLAAHVAALQGRGGRARQELERAASTRNQAVSIYATEVAAAEAWTLRAEGRLAAARAVLRRAAEAAEVDGVTTAAASAWHDFALLGASEEALAPLARLVPTLQGPLPPARLLHVQALATGDADAADEASSDFSRCGAHLLAAEAARFAAACHGAAGRRGRELASRARAVECVAACDGLDPAFISQGKNPLGRLTLREREVVELAARGSSNRQIASELFVSARTVGNHLAHAYDKLGVRSRESLRSLVPLTVSE